MVTDLSHFKHGLFKSLRFLLIHLQYFLVIVSCILNILSSLWWKTSVTNSLFCFIYVELISQQFPVFVSLFQHHQMIFPVEEGQQSLLLNTDRPAQTKLPICSRNVSLLSSFLDFHVMVLSLYIIVLLAVCLAPLTFTCPCVMDRHSLKPRPDIIGRRGAPMVGWRFARPFLSVCSTSLFKQMIYSSVGRRPRPVLPARLDKSVQKGKHQQRVFSLCCRFFLIRILTSASHDDEAKDWMSVFTTAEWCAAFLALWVHSWASKYCYRPLVVNKTTMYTASH